LITLLDFDFGSGQAVAIHCRTTKPRKGRSMGQNDFKILRPIPRRDDGPRAIVSILSVVDLLRELVKIWSRRHRRPCSKAENASHVPTHH